VSDHDTPHAKARLLAEMCRATGWPVLVVVHAEADQWVVDPCPFCGQQHRHGVGRGERFPHCNDIALKAAGLSRSDVGSYWLVAE
jgi:hypothetical protein